MNKNPNEDTRFKSGKEAETLGRKGGIKSGQSRNIICSFKESFKSILTDEDKLLIVRGLINQAKSGNIRAYEVLIDTIGENNNLEVKHKGYTLEEWNHFLKGDTNQRGEE